MAEIKHLIITGERGSGKTHLINVLKNVLNCSDSPYFLTSRKSSDKSVIINSGLIDNNQPHIIGKYNESKNKMDIVESGFIDIAIPAINHFLKYHKKSDLFFIDELGYLETSCVSFQKAVINLFDNASVIAVIRKQHTDFIDKISNRPDVFVVDIDTAFSNISCIVMASGLSKRFGSNKLLTSYNNSTLIENAIKISHFSGYLNNLVVTRHQEVIDICSNKRETCVLHNFPDRNDAVKLGVSTILSKHKPLGIMFLPSDQPLISKTSMMLLSLAFIYNRDKICRLSFNNEPGSPIIFPPEFYDELMKLPPKCGGSFIAKKYPEQVILVPAREKYELYDIDTPEDIRLLNFSLLEE